MPTPEKCAYYFEWVHDKIYGKTVNTDGRYATGNPETTRNSAEKNVLDILTVIIGSVRFPDRGDAAVSAVGLRTF